MQNTVAVNSEGLIEAKVIGDQTSETFEELFKLTEPVVFSQRQKGLPVLGLVDLTRKGKYTPGSNKAAMQLLENMDYDRVAMFGAEAVLKEVTEAIILAMGKHDNTKLFHTREEAVAWLKSSMESSKESSGAAPEAV